MWFSRILAGAIVFGLALFVGSTPAAHGATLTVDSTADTSDFSTADGFCDTDDSVGDGPCTLRAAIEQANFDAGTDTIAFSIAGVGPHTISPGSALPTITDPVIIDGTSEPDFVSTPVVELDGTSAGAGVDGLNITAGSSTVKGLVINRFDGDGIELATSGSNTIEGNYIGIDTAGTLELPNTHGVFINNVADNTVGGTTAAARNVISGNDSVSVYINGNTATGNKVEGNYLGTDATGTAALANYYGVLIGNNASNNTIGGTSAGARNIISGNSPYGISLAASGNNVEGNYIGTDVTGTADLGNSSMGVIVIGGSNTIGGTTAAARNVISGNNWDGVRIQGSAATLNTVQGNYIGTDVTGTVDLGNNQDGVYLYGAANSTIGGLTAGARNVISGNNSDGVEIFGAPATGNTVQGNYIGTDVTGTLDLGNTGSGVLINGRPSNTIGGTASGARNVISGNNQFGVLISGSGATGNVVEGNYVGTDVSGTADLGNTFNGVQMDGASGNTVGGTAAGAGNVISGNDVQGVVINGSGGDSNTVEGNLIGTQADGTSALGNGTHGVFIGSGGASDNTIGGTAAGAGNTIAFNGGDGVLISSGLPIDNLVSSNSIHSNAGEGIDLLGEGVTPNDSDDPDTGANNLQNYPVLTLAHSGGTTTTIQGTLDSLASTSFDLEFFSNTACDGSGYGEGETFIASTTVVTDVNGDASFAVLAGTAVAVGDEITATATDPSDNTSEFSACQEVEARVLTVNATGDAVDASAGNGVCETATPGECTLRAAIEEADALGGTDTIEFNIPGAGPHTISPGSAFPTIWQAVIIDGYSEPGASANTNPIASGSNAVLKIVLDGSGAGLGASGLTIASGGSTVKGLVINGFTDYGIDLTTSGGNTFEGNYVGTDVNGTADAGNGSYGVLLAVGSSTNTIGGTDPAARNIISGNGSCGVRISGGSDNIVRGNYIGPDATGAAALANGSCGVSIQGVTTNGNIVGGSAAGAGNVISGNAGPGVIIGGGTGNVLQGNLIGTQADGTSALGNTSVGAWISGDDTTVGGAPAGSGNTIAFNNAAGVAVVAGTGNLIDPNSIHSNGGLGIDLVSDGVTLNDLDDSDGGPNNLQNYPVLDTALYTAGNAAVVGSLNSVATTTFAIEFFSNSSCDGSGFGEGETFVDSTNVTTDGTSPYDAAISVTLTGVSVGDFLTSTATDPSDNTSEFSACVEVLLDSDGDGEPDATDVCPNDPNDDIDSDGICVGSGFNPPKTGGNDNCPTTPNPGQANADGDQWGDACDNCPSTVTGWFVPPGDTDCDGSVTGDVNSGEVFFGTDPADPCSDTPTMYDERGSAFGEPEPAWAFDINDDQLADFGDILAFAPHFNKTFPDPAYSARFDFYIDGTVDFGDVLQYVAYFNKDCTDYFAP